jgi:hypothetical protein
MYGDTDVMRKHAGRLREQGSDLRVLADRLVAQTEATGWAGRAAEALVERIRDRAARLHEVAARHDSAAQALQAHLVEVDRLKEAIADAEHGAETTADTPPAGHKDWLTTDVRDR